MSKLAPSALKRQDSGRKSGAELLLKEFGTIAMIVYFLVVFILMPLYIYDHYYEMAFYKWKIYFFSTVSFLGIFAFLGIGYLLERKKRGQIQKGIPQLYVTDVLAVLYGVSVLVTLCSCGYPRAAWLGTDSWYMGALAQLLFIGTFFVFSKFEAPLEDVVWMNLIASTVCFVIGIAQRYGWDFLQLYDRMSEEVLRDYLSTIGNRTWYSGYISVMFPIGLYLFWREEQQKKTRIFAIYVFIAFSAIVTNNSDSIYATVLAVFFLLFVMSVGQIQKVYRWLCIVEIWFCASFLMVLLRIQFPKDVPILRGLSKIFLDLRVVLAGTILIGIMIFLIKYLYDRKILKETVSRTMCFRLQVGCIVVAIIGIASLVGIIILNTYGYLQKWFGFTINNKYLLFDEQWGDFRGFNWKMTLHMFHELPLCQKLFGVGSDCYAFYAYSNPKYSEILRNYMGQDSMLSNAHNEWLNALFCHGYIGGLLYLGLFVVVMVLCLKQNSSEHVHPFVPAVGLCVVGYMAHNIFCYQQICATGPVFILMGLAVQKTRIGGRTKV